MSSSSLYLIGITCLVIILTVESTYYAYTYDDGFGDDEHCCMVRVQHSFCFATPITRSLIQVNKQCHQYNEHKHPRFNMKTRNNKYLDQISRRLNIQTTEDIGDKILLELKTPLEKEILDNDLICLATAHTNINLEKCSVELIIKLDDDHDDDDHKPHKRRGHRRRHRHRDSDHKKRAAVKNPEEEDNTIADDANTEENTQAEPEVNRFAVDQPVHIREGHGLALRQMYQINPSNIRPKTRQERQCWSWYREQTRKLRKNSSKHRKLCVNLNDHREKCISQLAYGTLNNTEANNTDQYTTVPLSIGSKLFCENYSGYNRFIGLYHRGEICFQSNNQVYVENLFSDTASISNIHLNKDTMRFIAKNKKFAAEFEDDCNDKTTLADISKSTQD